MKVLVIGADGGVPDLCRDLGASPEVLLYRVPGGPGPGRAVGISPDQSVHLTTFARRERLDAVLVGPGLRQALEGLKQAGYRAPTPAQQARPAARRLARALAGARLEGWQVLVPEPRRTAGVLGEAPDCTACGACCFSPLAKYVELLDDDVARLDDATLTRLTVERDGKRCMRMVDHRCVALRTQDGRFVCSIYEQRPTACREFEHAQRRCRVVRRERFREVSWVARHGRPAKGLLRSDLLAWRPGIAHAFTTRAGGVSTGPLESLNLARRPGEEDQRLVENWRRVVAGLGPDLSPDALALISQVHGKLVLTVEAGAGPLDVVGEADALVTTTPGVVLAVRAADCVPVLLVAPGGVAAVHSGWRGTAAGVVPAAVEALLAATGAQVETVAAAIGPHISGAAYEVGDEVVDGLIAGGLDRQAFQVKVGGSRPHVDLGAAIVAQLRACGVPEIERLGACTHGEARFFSHRRDGAATGRQAAVITLVP